MNPFSFALLSLKRDWHSDEIQLIAIAVTIAIACLTSVSFFTDRIKRATELQATELLAADLVVSSPNHIDYELVSQAKALDLITSLNESFRSIVLAEDRLEMSEVKAVDSKYPVRGKLRISDALFADEYETDTVPAVGDAWLDSRLAQALQIQPGDTLNLGAATFTFRQVLNYEPDRSGDLFNLAPRLLINRDDLAATELIMPGSRVRYRLLLGGEAPLIDTFRQIVNKDSKISIQRIKEARPEIRTALERAEQFLGLAALVSIALAGLAIAMCAHRYAIRHYDNCAILRCLGLQQQQISQIYCYQLIILALIAGGAGCIIGFLAQAGLNQLMSGLIQNSLPAPSLLPIVTGLVTSLVTVLAFALPQILQLSRVTPLRVLRRDILPQPLNNYFVYGIAILALIILSPWQSGETQITFYTLAGLFLTALVLAISATILISFLKHIQPRLTRAARYGLANLTRRARQSTIQIVGIGIGVTMMLLLTLVRTDLLAKWQNQLPENTPNYFLINIQPEQVDDVRDYLQQYIGVDGKLYPMIRGRLTKINDVTVDEDNYTSDRARRLATREFNLSYIEEMQLDNRLVSGSWWSDDRSNPVFSVEQGIAKTLGISQGDTLTYVIGAREITGKVINVRRVEWDSFNVNFFVVSNPEALADYPGTFISSFFMSASEREKLVELVRQFPSITVFDVDAILYQVRTIMRQVVRTVEFVFIFTIFTGMTVLFAALQSTHDERMHESALMRALGANQKQIVSGLTTEFIFLGLVTGFISALAASAIEMALAHYVFKIDMVVNPLIWIVGPLACCLISIVTGLYGTRRVLTSSPVLVLRKA